MGRERLRGFIEWSGEWYSEKRKLEPGSPKKCLRYFRPRNFTVKRLLPLYCEHFYSDPTERSSAFFRRLRLLSHSRIFLSNYPLDWILWNNAGTSGGSHRFYRVLACQGERMKNCKKKLDPIVPVRYSIKSISAAEAVWLQCFPKKKIRVIFR